jgi:hypothetical protein
MIPAVEWMITWGGDPEDVLVTTSGEASVEGTTGWVQDVIDDLRFQPELRVLVDHRTTRLSAMTREDVHRRADLITRDKHRFGVQRVAFVVRNLVDYGVARKIQLLTEARRPFLSRVFLNMDEARQWLAESSDAMQSSEP